MLAPYKYINHDMEYVQKFINYIFGQIWLKANVEVPYSFNLFKNNKYNKLISDLYVSNSKASDKFCRLVEDTYNIFALYPQSQKLQLKNFYVINLNIKNLCENISLKPLSYDDFDILHPSLSKKIKEFNDLLYGSGSILELKELLNISSIKEHYKKFIKENKNVCLFCGIEKLEVIENYRSDYDHFFPKSKYPFISINLKNLAPTCDKCNRKYKLQKDPLYNHTTRRKVLYPYSVRKYTFNINMTINTLSSARIEPNDINIDLNISSIEETDTWNDLYNIKNRYQGVCSFDDEAKNWLDNAKIVMKRDHLSFEQYIELEKFRYKEQLSPFHEKMFLKVPFLEACKNIEIFKYVV